MKLPADAAQPYRVERVHVAVAVRGRRIGVAIAGADGLLRVLGCRPRTGYSAPELPAARLLERIVRRGNVERLITEHTPEPSRTASRAVALTTELAAEHHGLPFDSVACRDLTASFLPDATTTVVPLLRQLLVVFPELSHLTFLRVPKKAQIAKLVAAALAIRSVQLHS